MTTNNTTNQQGFVLWMTGLSGAGKTTIALILEKELRARGVKIERLDGDVVRESLTRDLGFSKEDRDKNIERVTFVAKLLSRNGVGCICSFISPYQAVRDQVRANTTNFLEVFVDAPLQVVMDRDVKGLYKKAIAGEIPNFTGISDPFEAPSQPDIHIHTDQETPAESAQRIIDRLEESGFIPTLEFV
jgi:adenylyl-sulfate kinase